MASNTALPVALVWQSQLKSHVQANNSLVRIVWLSQVSACWGHEFTGENCMVEPSLRSYHNVGFFHFNENFERGYLIVEAQQICQAWKAKFKAYTHI